MHTTEKHGHLVKPDMGGVVIVLLSMKHLFLPVQKRTSL